MSNGNGLKIPLVINSGMLVAALIAVVTLWGDVRALAEDVSDIKQSPVTEARVVAIELNLKHLTTAVEKMSDEHEESTREILTAIRNSD